MGTSNSFLGSLSGILKEFYNPFKFWDGTDMHFFPTQEELDNFVVKNKHDVEFNNKLGDLIK